MSVTKWESSEFGGFFKLLADYPYISCPLDLDWKITEATMEKLGYYKSDKLMNIFFLKVKEMNLTDNILNFKVEKHKTYYGIEKEVAILDKNHIEHAVDVIASSSDEMSSLFSKFKEDIVDAKIFFDLPSGKSSKGDHPSEGEGTPKEEISESEIAKALAETISKVRKPSTWSNSPSLGKSFNGSVTFKNVIGHKQIVYDNSEILYAKRLSDRMDISFDPERDVVQNLRIGKLNTGKIAQIEAGFHNIHYKIEERQKTKPFSVCILGDESGSMGGVESGTTLESALTETDSSGSPLHFTATKQHHLMKMLYKAFRYSLTDDKIYIYGHSGHHDAEIRVYQDPYNPNFEKNFSKQGEQEFVQNYDGPVIEKIYERIRAIDDSPILMILISDSLPEGYNYGGFQAANEMKKIIEKCRRDQFVTCGINLNYASPYDIYDYKVVVNDGIKTIDQISTVINKIVKLEFQT